MKLKHKDEYPKPYGLCFVGGYSLDLYCANDGHAYRKGLDSFGGNTKADCVRYARSAGWIISRDEQITICPDCAKEKKKENCQKP